MNWLAQLIHGLGLLLRVLFGTDKPAQIEVHDARTALPVSDDDQLLDDLGLRRVQRPDLGADDQG